MKQYIKITFSLIFGLTLLSSCEDFLEVEPEEVVLTDNYLGDDALDARSALFGILAQAQDLYGQMRVLGEMRADLVDINENTIEDIKEIRDLEFSEDNVFVDATQLFSMINNCNFAIAGIDIEAYDGRLYDEYAAILRLRTWLQMQVLINYGKLPYIDEPIVSSDDFNKEYPVYGFDEALNQMIINLTEIAGVENPSDYGVYSMIPDNDILLGDLHLWAEDYENAAISYKRFLDNQFDGGPAYLMNSFLVNVDGSDGDYTEDNNWVDMFEYNFASSENINYFFYEDDYQQSNNDFQMIFNQFGASQALLQKWGLQSKYSQDDFVGYEQGDNRAESYLVDEIIGVSYGDGVVAFSGLGGIVKYKENYYINKYYRAAKVYLRYAEAINYAGYPNHALEIVNGVFNNPDVLPVNSILLSNTPAEVEYLHFYGKGYFDDDDEPTSGLRGVRGRVAMAPVSVAIDTATVVTNAGGIYPPVDTNGDPLTGDDLATYYEGYQTHFDENAIGQVGNLILEEAALELAFEGNRWEDLVRFSRREGTSDIIKNAIETKFLNSPAGYGNINVLDSESGWYLPLTIPDNFVDNSTTD